MKVDVPAGSPSFASSMARSIERGFVAINPTAPVRLPSYPSTDLPDPAPFAGCLIWVNNSLQVAVSDGTNWYPITVGAHL